MLILKDRKPREAIEIFTNVNDLIIHIKRGNDKINTNNLTILELIGQMYSRLVNDDGLIKFSRFSRWYPKQLGFKYKNVLQVGFWLERGWSEIEAKKKISKIMSERADKATKTKAKEKKTISVTKIEKFKFKSAEFSSNEHPTCNNCSSMLSLTKVNIQNKSDNYYYKITGCPNTKCTTNVMCGTEKYKAYLPFDVAELKLKEIKDNIKRSNPLCLNYWLNRGYNNEDALKEISKIQSYNSSLVKNRFIVSKENLKKRGFSDDEIKKIFLTPASVEFWLNKGFSFEEAKIKVYENQSNASKHVDYNKRLLPSNIEYWTKQGFNNNEAKQKVSESQSTFSKEKCIEKYGEEEGLKRFTERQHKWQASLVENGNLKMGYSKISQELFYDLLIYYSVDEREKILFATHNKEFRLNKTEGGIWLYDFTDLKNKKIIEYNGDDYHANPKKYLAEDYPNPFNNDITAQEIWDKDDRKISLAKENGFDVMVIWDSEYRWGNKKKIINKCLEFLGKK